MQCGRIPDDGRTPVVTKQNGLLLGEMIDESKDIRDHVFHVVSLDRGGRVAAAIAANIRHHYAITGLAYRSDLVPPRIPGLRPAMNHEHQRSLSFNRTAQVHPVGSNTLERGQSWHRTELR